MDGTVVAAFGSAADLAGELLRSAAVGERWKEGSAVEGFSVGGLAAHMVGATLRLQRVLDEAPPEGSPVVTLTGCYGLNRVNDPAELETGMHPLIRADGERRAAMGQEAVAGKFAAVVSGLLPRLATESDERLVPVLQPQGAATTLRVYVVTRIIELLVHSDDLAVSAGRDGFALPREAADVVMLAFLELARERAGDLAVMRAFTRRERQAPDILRVL
ncbi:MAG: hypothetical protein E6J14_12090 [Chloroflexi bacterium]|nr:MAG: hypothetical protein E6J14_12090 [Chloroflexota bacterium]